MRNYNYGLRQTKDGRMMDNLNTLVCHTYMGDGSTLTVTDEGDGFHIYKKGREVVAFVYNIPHNEIVEMISIFTRDHRTYIADNIVKYRMKMEGKNNV